MRMRQQLRPVAHPGRRRSQPVCRTEASAGHPRDRPGPGVRWHSRAFTSGHPGRDWPDPCRRELPAGPQSASGRDHRGSYAGGQVRGHRLAADCRPVPRAGPLGPVPGDRDQPGGSSGDGRRAPSRAGDPETGAHLRHLAAYAPLHAAYADLLERAGETDQAAAAWSRAAEATGNAALREELLRRSGETGGL